MAPMASPFHHDGPVEPADLIDRDPEAAALLDRALDGHNSRLTAPRRYGKTSLLLRVQAEAARHDMQPVYVNFFGVVALADVSERVELGYRQALQGPVRRWFDGVARTLRPALQAGVPGAGVSVAPQPQPQQASLLERLALPRRFHAKYARRSLIVFDEFQDLLRAGDGLDAVFRSEIEQQRDVASYIFAGSHPGMMTELFATRRRAFYGQASPVTLGGLDPEDVAAYVTERFARDHRDPGEALRLLLDAVDGHPQRTMLLAHHVWEQTAPGTSADTDTWRAAFGAVGAELEGEFEAVWRGYTTTESRLLTAIAADAGSLLSAQSRARTGLPKTGSHRKALDRLTAEGDIEKAATQTGYRIVDPLFAYWVRSGRGWAD
jgi:hypothetical protein